jgi:hypothetical protein
MKKYLHMAGVKKCELSWVWWHTYNPSTWEDHEFEASLGYIARSYLKN